MSPASLHRPAVLRLTESEQKRLGKAMTGTERRHWVIAWWRFMIVIEVPQRWCRQDRPTVPAPTYMPRTDPKERTR